MVTLLLLSLTRPEVVSGHYKSPTQSRGGGKFLATPVPAVKAPRGNNLTQLTGDDFHLIPAAPNYFVMATLRSNFQHQNFCRLKRDC